MAKTWDYMHGNDHIKVVNRAAREELYVNGELQDRHAGSLTNAHLTGALPGGEQIKAQLGGFWSVQCNLFVNNKLLTPMGKK